MQGNVGLRPDTRAGQLGVYGWVGSGVWGPISMGEAGGEGGGEGGEGLNVLWV